MTLYVNNMLSFLEAQGEKIIAEAKRTKDTQNRSYNQYDAYGFLVYYNGQLKRWSASPPMSNGIHPGWEKYDIPAATGEKWAEMFKSEFEPPKTGFTLVVFNAAFYSLIQEEGAGKLTRSFRIISQVVGSMKDLQNQFRGATLKSTLK